MKTITYLKRIALKEFKTMIKKKEGTINPARIVRQASETTGEEFYLLYTCNPKVPKPWGYIPEPEKTGIRFRQQ